MYERAAEACNLLLQAHDDGIIRDEELLLLFLALEEDFGVREEYGPR